MPGAVCWPPGGRRPLGRRAPRRYHPGIRIHPADGLPGPRDGSGSPRRHATSWTSSCREGGWNNYPDGPVELSVSVKAYFALKLAGHDPEAPYMRRARDVIRAWAGPPTATASPSSTWRCSGQFPYANCPAVPPEMMLLPRWAYFNIYAMSSWTRTIVVPLSIFYAHKPVRRLPPELGIAELFLEPPETPLWPHPPTRRWLSLDQFLPGGRPACSSRWSAGAWGRSCGSCPCKQAQRWMLEHSPTATAWGPSSRPSSTPIVSLRCLGYRDDSPEMQLGPEAAGRPDDRGGRHACACSPASRRSGTRP